MDLDHMDVEDGGGEQHYQQEPAAQVSVPRP